MRNILIVDERRSLQESIEAQLIVEELDESYRVTVFNPESADDIVKKISERKYDLALIENEELNKVSQEDFGSLKVYGYKRSSDTPELIDKNHIPFMGQAHEAPEIIAIIQDIFSNKIPETKTETEETKQATAITPKGQRVSEKPENTFIEPAYVPKEGMGENHPRAPETPVKAKEADTEELKSPYTRPEQKSLEEPLRGDLMRQAQIERSRKEYLTAYEECPKEKRTQTIAVYSAKGGVGKTTIATNLALYLAMLPHGLGTYRVCLVDYNIESGDVRTLLGFQDDGKTLDMGLWADDIHQQLERKRQPQDINYNQNQIAGYLMTYDTKRTGLSVLLAPALHENAQYIEADETEIMLRNIIENGGFDFVICDTADNTSDGSVNALMKADMTLLICTQDVSTANRNDSVLRSLKRAGIDTTKIRIVINNVMSKHKAGISVGEVERYFDEYECIGKIREDPHVKFSNNYSKPIVKNERRHFRKDILPVLQYILKESENPQKEEKRRKKKGPLSR